MIIDPVSYETSLIKDIGKSLFLNPTNDNGTDKNNQHAKIENLTIELAALKLFAQEQFYIIKKQLEETIPESTKQLPFSSLQSETEYLRMFKITRIDISIFHCVICSQLLLLCFPEVVSMNTFINDQINIFPCKRLKYYFFA